MTRTRFRFPSSAGDILGAHVSTLGGLHTAFERATAIGAGAIAIFSKNSNQWKAKPLTDDDYALFRSERKRSRIRPLFVHASYLINLAAVNEILLEKSIHGMAEELQRAERLGAQGIVLHPGAHMGAGSTAGVDRIARSLDQIHALVPECSTVTLLETSAGQGTSLGCTFQELGSILRLVDEPSRLGVCFDTCHVFAAGYDIRTRDGWEQTVERLDREVGLRNVGAFHLNDSKRELGSHVDRHQHIGEGWIGLAAFELLLNDRRFRRIAKVLETPKADPIESDRENLRRLRALIQGS